MHRGTTPTITITIDNLSEFTLDTLWVTFEQEGGVEITKELNNVEVDGDIIRAQLTQEDTLSFTAGTPLYVQVRFRAIDGQSYTHDKFKLSKVKDILKEGVI